MHNMCGLGRYWQNFLYYYSFPAKRGVPGKRGDRGGVGVEKGNTTLQT
jgi:hypothetical protein